MNGIVKTVLVNYAVCAFLGGILEFLVPRSGKRTMRAAAVAVLIAVTLAPILKAEDINFNSYLPNEEESVTYDSSLLHTENLMKKEIKNDVQKRLINLGINEYEIYISTKTDEQENTVILTELKIIVGDKFAAYKEKIIKEFDSDYGEIISVGVKDDE